MTDNLILVGAERQAQLEAAKAAFFASGGQVLELATYRAAPLPARSGRLDPETVLNRKRRRPTPADRSQIRRMTEAL